MRKLFFFILLNSFIAFSQNFGQLSGKILDSKTQLPIDLNESDFSSLREVGGWFNYTAKNLLLVRVSESIIRAFDNSCPHQGSRNSWSYSNNTFRCSTHGNEFSNSCNSALRCYNSSLSGNILTISN